MLKLTEPIQLKSDPNIITLSSSFSQRMIGNYDIVSCEFEADELLHFVTAPAEVYLAEGGANSFVNISSNKVSNDVKVELINNVLNRIVLAQDNNITYQDRIFIEQTLRKLGITDVNQFMREVSILKQETDNIHALQNLYWTNLETLNSLTRVDNSIKADAESVKSGTEDNRSYKYYLHEDIYNRLGTRDLYLELKNYIIDSYSWNNNISNAQMAISEQNHVFNQMFANELKYEATGIDNNLVYNTVNSYELVDEDIEEVSLTTMQNQLVKAIMSNAISYIYDLKYDTILKHEDRLWLNMATAINEITENTYKRFEEYHIRKPISDKAAAEYHTSISNNQLGEIEILYNVLNEYGGDENYYSGGDYRYEEDIRVFTEAPEYQEITVIQGDNLEDNDYRKQLDIINEKNIENAKKISEIKVEELAKPKTSTKIDRRKAMSDALRALNNDNKLMLEYLETPTREEQESNRIPEAYRAVYAPETVEILEAYNNLVNNREITGDTKITFDMENTLISEIREISEYNEVHGDEVERVYRIENNIDEGDEITTERSYTQVDNVDTTVYNNEVENYITRIHNEMVNRYESGELSLITDQILKLAPVADLEGTVERQLTQVLPRRVDTVKTIVDEHLTESLNLTHKETEQQINEEYLEELIRNNTTNQIKKTEEKKENVTTTTVEQVTNTTVNDVKVTDEREIVRLIAENVDSRIGSLSEQVYNRLEKKMDRERRRRGI